MLSVVDDILALIKRNECNIQYLTDRVEAWATEQQLRLGLCKVYDLMKQGKVAEAQAQAIAAAQFKAQTTDKGYLTPSEILEQPDIKWLASGLIPEGALCCLAGEPGLGKSFLALNLAWSIASGNRFLDSYAVQQGLVVYITCENRHGLGKRLAAYSQYFGSVPENRFMLIKGQYGLNKPDDLAKVLNIIDGLPTAPVLIVIDTVNRYLSGSENDAKDMAAFVAGLTTMQQKYSAAILAVHHTGKDASKYERGHTALRGACETMMLLDSEEQLLCYKQNHAREFAPLSLYKHDVGTSCVYLPLSEAEQKTKVDKFLELFGTAFVSLADIDYEGLCSQATAYRWAEQLVEKQKLTLIVRKDGTRCFARM